MDIDSVLTSGYGEEVMKLWWDTDIAIASDKEVGEGLVLWMLNRFSSL